MFSSTTKHLTLAAGLAAVAAGALAPAANAETILDPAPGARGLAAAGGYTAWSAPDASGAFKVTVRAPDGTKTQPAIGSFAAPPKLTMGTSGGISAGGDARHMVLGYETGEDIRVVDLRTGALEPAHPVLAAKGTTETKPSLSQSSWAFARPSGRGRGIYVVGTRDGAKAPRKVTSTVPLELATNGTRVLYATKAADGFRITLRRVSGEGAVVNVAKGLPTAPRSLSLTRYNASWIAGDQVFSTARFVFSAGVQAPATVQPGRIVAGIDSLAAPTSVGDPFYLDARGVHDGDRSLFTAPAR